jgi:hypothetical protein
MVREKVKHDGQWKTGVRVYGLTEFDNPRHTNFSIRGGGGAPNEVTSHSSITSLGKKTATVSVRRLCAQTVVTQSDRAKTAWHTCLFGKLIENVVLKLW